MKSSIQSRCLLLPAWWLVLAALLIGVDMADAASPQVAVLDFKAENGANESEDWTVGLADFVELALQKEGVLTLERRQIRLVLGERELQAGGMAGPDDLLKRGLPKVDYFVSGNVRRLAESEFELTVALHRADNATMEHSFTRRGVYPSEWLPAIDSVARDLSARLGRTTRLSPERRSEFESLTWLPEAALPFFKGLEYYARGDYPLAAGWFRTASAKDPRFGQARLWESRALRRFGFNELAEFAIAAAGDGARNVRTNSTGLPVVAVMAPESIPVAGRSAFSRALAQSGRLELFDPQAIGATAREIDLKLTGQMAAPLNERSVWLVVDSIVVVEAEGGQLRARQSDLLSGRVLREVTVSATGSDAGFVRLAEELLAARMRDDAADRLVGVEPDAVEPKEDDRPEIVFGKVLRLAKAHPEQARPWVGLCDFYSEWKPRMLLLNRAIAAIESSPDQHEASFWLTSALWRKRSMVRRAYFYPDATGYEENPLTHDFALLLKLFPESKDARSFGEWTHKAGIYTYSHPTNRAYINAAYGGQIKPVWVAAAKPAGEVSEGAWLATLKKNVANGDNAKAWMQANWRVPPLSSDAKEELERINAGLLEIARREQEEFNAFTNAIGRGENQRALELGRGLLRCLFRSHRLEVIEKCGELLKTQRGCEAQVSFMVAQLDRYKEDFSIDPVTGAPRTETITHRFDSNKERPSSWANLGVDLTCSSVLGGLVENGTVCGNLELTASIYDALRSNETLPEATRLTAMFDLARIRYDQGRPFEAMELLQELLTQIGGADVPQARGSGQISVSLESSVFGLLKKIRLFADPEVNFADCCGEMPRAPLPEPENLEEMNRWFDDLWSQVRGGVGVDNRSIKEQLFERRAEVLPAMLYNLQRRDRAQQLLLFAGWMGTNALETLPFVVHYVCASEPYPYTTYGNALAALANIGKPAACSLPVLILASEGTDHLQNVNAALSRVGVAPPAVMPFLARLLYHQSPTVAEKAARAMVQSAGLKGPQFDERSAEALVLAVRGWWERNEIAGMRRRF